MIKVYSINEIVDASKKLFEEPQKNKKESIINNQIVDSKKKEINNSLNKAKGENLAEKSIPKDIENIIAEAENSQIQTKINKSTKEFNQENEYSLEKITVNKDELIESMHKTFSKKIKKNTLKLILDLREEIIFLTKNISILKKQKNEEEFSKKILKKNFTDLTNIENNLKNDLKNTQIDLDLLKKQNQDLNLNYASLIIQHYNLNLNHTSLKEKNENLNLEHTTLKEQHGNLNLNHTSLKEKNENLNLEHTTLKEHNDNLNLNQTTLKEKNENLNLEHTTLKKQFENQN
ncbi:hypothetical protein N8Z07_04970 [Pelagibacteraceae bacterium]|nr:hypothetical protein [Pelagibacteraceae bacterium]